MHPEISRLPSNLFYGGRLQDGPEMALKTKKPWHVNAKFGTYKFYNVARGQEQKGSHRSLVNRTESQIAVALYNRLITEYSSYDFEYKVGVVSMYRAQVGEIRRAFEQRFGSNILATVDFNTVDGFQGQEKEIIILSCVRAGPGLQNVGFLSGRWYTYAVRSWAHRLYRHSSNERCFDSCEVICIHTWACSDAREERP